jgi:hypothetical protein
LNELFNDALRTSEVILAFEEWYKDSRCQVCKVLSQSISGRWAATKIPEKIKSVGFISGVSIQQHRMSATTNNFFFARKEWPEKARNVLYNV